MRSKPRTGLQGIHTMTDIASEANNGHRKYLKLAVLEMEKVRHSKEQHRARQRVADIDKRLVEIEAEQSAFLKLVSREPKEEDRQEQLSPCGRRGFTFKY